MKNPTPGTFLNKPLAPRKAEKALLSPQVSDSGSRYFFLNPGARKSSGTLALGGLEHCNPDYRIDRVGFAYHVIEYIVEGAGWVKLGSSARHTLGAGSVFLCEKTTRCVMNADPAKPLVKYFLCMNGSGVLRRLARAGLRTNRVCTLAAQGEIKSVLEDLIREGRRPGARAVAICDVLFELLRLKTAEALDAHVGRSAFEKNLSGARENFQRCKAIIDEQGERFGTLAEIAAEARLDVSSVCRLFRRHQGISPYQYLLRRKMNIAAEFLVDGGGLVKEAAQRVGFADALHFSRVFRAVHGVSPSELQRRGGKELRSSARERGKM